MGQGKVWMGGEEECGHLLLPVVSCTIGQALCAVLGTALGCLGPSLHVHVDSDIFSFLETGSGRGGQGLPVYQR